MNLLGRAALIDALASGDKTLLKAAATLAGYEELPEIMDVEVALPIMVAQRDETPPIQIQKEKSTQAQPTPLTPFCRLTRCEYLQPMQRATAEEETPISTEGWTEQDAKKAPDFSPLTRWVRLLPYLHRAAQCRTAGSRLDMHKIVSRLSQGEILQQLPHQPHSSWSSDIHIVLDRSDRLTPYWEDQTWLATRLTRLLPTATYKLAMFWEGMKEPAFADESHGDYQPPGAGGLVLVLGDLGSLSKQSNLQQTWHTFAQRLRNRDCRALALLPCSSSLPRSPHNSLWQTLHWERQPHLNADLREPLQKLLILLSPAIRIEPGLLRTVRRWQNMDAAIESLFWQHAALSGTSSLAATLEPKRAQDLRKQFDQLDQLSHSERLQLLKHIRDWRHKVPEEIWFEECVLNPGIHHLLHQPLEENASEALKNLQRMLQKDLEQAEQFFQHLGQKMLGGANVNLRYWYHHLKKRIPEPAKHVKTLQPALNRLWHSLSHDEANAPKPAGYNPADIPSQAPLRTFQVFRQTEHLHLIEAPHAEAAKADHNASWLGSLHTRNGQIVLEKVAKPRFWQQAPPAWASDWGWDEYGAWLAFQFKNVSQRLRWIPPGDFLMGSPDTEQGRYDDESPQHSVTLSQGFWLFDTPVTQVLWQAVMGDNPSYFQSPTRPVEQVSWDDAQRFIQQLNSALSGLHLTLPTEAQWEYACRAGTDTATYAGNLKILGERHAPILDDIAWYGGNCGVDFELEEGHDISGWSETQYQHQIGGTHPVAQKQANAYGLYDMLGNVYEWCGDYWQSAYPSDAQSDPTGPTEGSSLVQRGGSWDDGAHHVRSAFRYDSEPGVRYLDFGFRCALVQSEHPPVQATVGWVSDSVTQQASPQNRIELRQTQQKPPQSHVELRRDDSSSQDSHPPSRLTRSTQGEAVAPAHSSRPDWVTDMGRDEYGVWAEFNIKDHTQRLRWINPGTFLMGSPESEIDRDKDEIQHEVTLSQGYWLFDTAVTQGLWQAVMGDNSSRFKGDDRPVEKVSWEAAQAFIHTLNQQLLGLGLALPTEAQWEYACRANTQTPFHFGDNITPEQVNYNGKHPYAEGEKGLYRQKTILVKALPCNAWGLYQMHGNVREWCQDWFGSYQREASIDPTGATEGTYRVVRGGSWFDLVRFVRSAYRTDDTPGLRGGSIGFRCALVQSELQPEQLEEAQPVLGEAFAREPHRQHPPQGEAAGHLDITHTTDYQLPCAFDNDLILRTDSTVLHFNHLLCPAWADAIGHDQYGLWTDIVIEALPKQPGDAERPIRQRLRWIPPGRFLMGSPDDEPERKSDEIQHEVTLTEGFWLFDTTVTQALWTAVQSDNPSRFKGEEHPVEKVSWEDSQAFIKQLQNTFKDALRGFTLCLPTEAQWEYAGRAGTQTPFSFGHNITPEQVNYNGYHPYNNGEKGEYRKKNLPVKALPCNAWGLYQMHGNVWEWCQDKFDQYQREAQINPTGAAEGTSRVVRGGSWDSNARYVRSAFRYYDEPVGRFYYIGFRCALVGRVSAA